MSSKKSGGGFLKILPLFIYLGFGLLFGAFILKYLIVFVGVVVIGVTGFLFYELMQ